jgi:hypothetical protein
MQHFETLARSGGSAIRIQVWHTLVLVAFVAVAIANIQDQGRSEPALIAIATGGFVAYGILGGIGWRLAHGASVRFGRLPALIVYFTAMAGLFLVATLVYLAIEEIYLN